MKRNIVTTIEFSKGQVSLTVLEKFSSNNIIEIFNARGLVKMADEFLSTSFDKIKNLLGAPIKIVNVVLEMSSNIDAKVALAKLEYRIPGKEVTNMDIDNALELVRKEKNVSSSVPILVQPIRFDVHSGATVKSYSQAPIHKSGSHFNMLCSVTTISVATFDFVAQTVKKLNLELDQILLEPQTTTHCRLSENALSSGAIMLQIAENQSFVTVTKNFVIVGILPIYSLGLKALLNGIAKCFMCTPEQAKNILLAHGAFDPSKDQRVIFTRQNGFKEEVYTSGHLRSILTQFMQNMMMQIVPWLKQKNIANLPIVIAGGIWRLTKVSSFIESCFPGFTVSLYNPLSFIELNEANTGCLGVINFQKSNDKILVKQYNNVIETNPGALSSLSLKDRLRLYSKSRVWTGGEREH